MTRNRPNAILNTGTPARWCPPPPTCSPITTMRTFRDCILCRSRVPAEIRISDWFSSAPHSGHHREADSSHCWQTAKAMRRTSRWYLSTRRLPAPESQLGCNPGPTATGRTRPTPDPVAPTAKGYTSETTGTLRLYLTADIRASAECQLQVPCMKNCRPYLRLTPSSVRDARAFDLAHEGIDAAGHS